MKLRQKVIFLAIVPLIIALCAIAVAVYHQSNILAAQQRNTVQQAYLASKEAELQHYVKLATHSIAHLLDSGRKDAATLDEAKRILSALSYGEDGYFFIYDLQGKSLMHPRQPELVGQNLWAMRDASGNPTIQRLIERARAGGGFERYSWIKPSSHQTVAKLGYVIPLPQWGWMLGTGIYLDDVDAALSKIDIQQSKNIQNTMLWIAAIATLSALIVGASGLVLNITELRVADAKLRVLAQAVVESQEQERLRLSRDLHDGIGQSLVSVKLHIEAGIIRLSGNSEQQASATALLERCAGQLTTVMSEVRRISQNLRPAILDDLGLAAALEHLAQEFRQGGASEVLFEASGQSGQLSEVANTMLYRVAQEALTNIKRHADARHIQIHLASQPDSITLRIIDDGCGFDVQKIATHPARGIGLRNMLERMESIGGELEIKSSTSGTVVLALVAIKT